MVLWALAALADATTARAQAPASTAEAAAALENVLVETIARGERSVVAIARVRRERPGEAWNAEVRPDPFGGRRVLPGPLSKPGDPDFMPNEYATGVVVDRAGLVLTVYHVLGEESDYYVTAHDRRTFRAKIVGADPRSDLAVLAPEDNALARTGTPDWVPIALGDGAGLRKGQIVVALGNPFGIARDGQASASWGILANTGRKAPPAPDETDLLGKPTIHHFGTLLQTDAKLNLGTSGGPLLNLQGEMVGLGTSLATAPGYERAAGYAIPLDKTFRRALDALKQGREVEYGFLGIQLGLPEPKDVANGLQGTRVERVLPNLPAARHGMRPGDLVTSVNGSPIRDSDGLVREVGKLPVDSTVRLVVLRGQRRMELDVELTKYRVRGKKIVSSPAPDWRGMRVDYATAVYDLYTPGLGGSPALGETVAVTDVEKGTPAWDAGLRSGMLISHVGRTPVRTPRQFQQAVAGKTGPVDVRLATQSGETPVRTVPAGS
jgi:S1-C subfamily serine protease